MADLYTRKADLGSIFKIRPYGQRKPRSLFPATVVQFPNLIDRLLDADNYIRAHAMGVEL
jgi:hypothetical protein